MLWLKSMCQALRFITRNLSESQLEPYYNTAQIRALKQRPYLDQYFWVPQTVLPLYTKTGILLRPWGNQSDYLPVPKTAWAKLESIRNGNWGHLEPKPVLIAAEAYLDGGFWWPLASGLTGLAIKIEGLELVYVVTKVASEKHKQISGLERQVIGEIIYGSQKPA